MAISAENRQSSIYPILAIDGGGIRGIIPATMLVEIEKITQKPISDLFPLIGGTSTGGILALGLSTPKSDRTPKFSAQDLLNMYTDPSSTNQIFKKNPSYREPNPEQKFSDRAIQAILSPKYLTPEDLLKSKFEDHRLSKSLTNVLITANTVYGVVDRISALGLSGVSMAFTFLAGAAGLKVPYIDPDFFPKTIQVFTTKGFKNLTFNLTDLGQGHCKAMTSSLCDKDFYMRDVARVTSAAPSFFPPLTYQGITLFDGGVLQNNPTVPCVLEAFEKGVPLKDMLVVSLGTGQAKGPLDPVSTFFEMTQPQHRDDQALGKLGVCNFRFQHFFENDPPHLDDCREETIARLKEAGKAVVDKAHENDLLRELCKLISPEMGRE
ncbi:MAG TPA: patatin-like phospholipase family protein [Chlamydiales bacterium]|nr:patatin-like phospholipase family protein [Chlamydiales bacterium]